MILRRCEPVCVWSDVHHARAGSHRHAGALAAKLPGEGGGRRQGVRHAPMEPRPGPQARRSQPGRVPLDLPPPQQEQRLHRHVCRHSPGLQQQQCQRHQEGRHSRAQAGQTWPTRVS